MTNYEKDPIDKPMTTQDFMVIILVLTLILNLFTLHLKTWEFYRQSEDKTYHYDEENPEWRESTDCESVDNMLYTSNPPQIKCKDGTFMKVGPGVETNQSVPPQIPLTPRQQEFLENPPEGSSGCYAVDGKIMCIENYK